MGILILVKVVEDINKTFAFAMDTKESGNSPHINDTQQCQVGSDCGGDGWAACDRSCLDDDLGFSSESDMFNPSLGGLAANRVVHIHGIYGGVGRSEVG